MAYEQRNQRRQKARYDHANADNKFKYQLVLDGQKVTPTSATITVYSPSSTTAILAATAMTVSGTLLTYSLDTTTEATFPIGEGYRAELAITYSAVVYKRHFIFDVVKYLLDINVGYDQLVAYDDSIRGMEHDGDEDFSALIESCRDHLQAKIETKIIEGDKLIENAIIDNSLVSIAAKVYILWRIFFNKGMHERASQYRADFDELWPSVLNTIKFDNDGDGTESAEIGGIQEVRLVT